MKIPRATGKNPPPARSRWAYALAAFAVVGVFAAPQSAQAAGTWQYIDSNGNGRSDIAAIDRNGDGSFDEAWVDVDEDGRWDIAAYDTNADGVFEWLNGWSNLNGSQGWVHSSDFLYTFIDVDGNGLFETHYFDGNRDGLPEYVQIDANSDGHADQWLPINYTGSSPSPSDNSEREINDMMVAHIVTLQQLDILAGVYPWG